MPRVIGQTPSWLSQPSPGARIFSDPESQSPASPLKRPTASRSPAKTEEFNVEEPAISRKTIAHRGAEIFTVVGNKIRWADLTRVKSSWEDQQFRRSTVPQAAKQYRTLKTPVYYEIVNISVSPSGRYLAIATEYTVHIALLPDSSRLHDGDTSDIKLKTYQLGPTIHVMDEAPLASVLWHPLAAASATTDCLTTVTTTAAVRLWEFTQSDHWSFNNPTLAIDMRKLADGTALDQNFEPAGFGTNRGFSVDEFDMVAAAATWGGQGRENEDPWAAMTLWVAMSNGNVYALCPLLPSKWRPAPTTIPAITTSVVASMATMDSEDLDADERKAADQRYEWIQELDSEDLASADLHDPSVRFRPDSPSAIPRLQGPFEIPMDEFDDVEITDILVIPANLDEEDLFSGEDDYDVVASKNLPFTIVCLATADDVVDVMLEMEGVVGQWLPKQGKGQFSVPTALVGEFVLADTITLDSEAANGGSVTFTSQPSSYDFFVTSGRSIHSISLSGWASRVGFEATESDTANIDAGLSSRLKLACQGSIALRQTLLSHQEESKAARAHLTCVDLIQSIDLGPLLLTSSLHRPMALQLEDTSFRTSTFSDTDVLSSSTRRSPFRTSQSLSQVLQDNADMTMMPPPVRAPYAPSPLFEQSPHLRIDRLKSQLPAQRRALLTQPLKLSPATLEVMTAAHREFSFQTSDIEKAASELFRRCERLREEMADQVRQMSEMADRLERLKTNGSDEQDAETPSKKLDQRVDAAKERQKKLLQQYERVRRRAGHAGRAKQDLSIKERTWISEIDALANQVGLENDKAEDTVSARTASAKALVEELKAQSRSLRKSTENQDKPPNARARLGLGATSRIQQQRVKEVMDMVERESLLIEAIQGRLSRLAVTTE